MEIVLKNKQMCRGNVLQERVRVDALNGFQSSTKKTKITEYFTHQPNNAVNILRCNRFEIALALK